MAWIFELAAEFGQDSLAADRFCHFFWDKKLYLTDQQEHPCQPQVIKIEGAIWCVVVPSHLTTSGVHNFDEAKLLTIAGEQLYSLLKETTGYRYAKVGIESECIGNYEEIFSDLVQIELPGLVMAKKMMHGIKPIRPLQAFSPGYVWWPYKGEYKIEL